MVGSVAQAGRGVTGHDEGPKEGAGPPPSPPNIHTEPCSRGQKTDTGILGLGAAITAVCPVTGPCLHAVTQRPALESQGLTPLL